MQKIIPHLWFDDKAEEAADYYISIFNNSKKLAVDYYDKQSAEVSGKTAGSILGVEYEIEGFCFYNINGGPFFQKNPSISFFVNCQTETEVDRLWNELSRQGKVLMPLDKYPFNDKYGWIEDKCGVSWQIVPEVLNGYLRDPDPEKASRVMKAFMEMKKLNLAEIESAYKGELK